MEYSTVKVKGLNPDTPIPCSLLFKTKPEVYFALKGTKLTQSQIDNLTKWDINELFEKVNAS